ncbi:MAG: right-handed parallel beta-helix repeat-containing protein [Phycisphaerales bacterium JB043]
MRSTLTAFAISGTLLISHAPNSRAGDLTPPSGAIQASGLIPINPQTATFPIDINQPGSYILLGNLTLSAATNGITISASDVTLDLNGFTLDGAGVGVEGIISGVAATENVLVRNGTVKNFVGGGVVLFNTTRAIIEDMRAVDNAIEGIRAADEAIVRRCVSSGSGGTGIYVADRSLVTDCQVQGEAATSLGVYMNDHSTVENCQITSTTSHGIRIFGEQCRVTNNTVRADSGSGVGIFQDNIGTGQSVIDSNFVAGFNPGIEVSAGLALGEVMIYRNTILDAAGTVGYTAGGNIIPVGLSSNPDTADAWDNLWWVTIIRAEDEPTTREPVPTPEFVHPDEIRRARGTRTPDRSPSDTRR